jgi:transcriptional regulator with XRE-family HTH domain
MDQTSDEELLSNSVDLGALGALLRRARREAAMKQDRLAARLGRSVRSISRWEHGESRLSRGECARIVAALAEAERETLRAIEITAGLVAPPPAPPALPARTPATDLRTAIDAAVRLYAEEIDVSPRKLRLVFALWLGDLERLGVGVKTARRLVLRKRKPLVT